jgi:hypothetical protein
MGADEKEPRMHSRVERGRPIWAAALPLVEPDMQISRIRLSRKTFVRCIHS